MAVNRIVSDLGGPTDTTSQWIIEQLDEFARNVRGSFPVGVDPSPQLKLEAMKQVFDQFTVREATLHEPSNKFHCALKNKVISNMNLRFLYKFVGRRIGLKVDIADEPGGDFRRPDGARRRRDCAHWKYNTSNQHYVAANSE